MICLLLALHVHMPDITVHHGPVDIFEASSQWSQGQIDMANLIVEEAHLLDADPYLLVALAMVESGLNSKAINKKANDVGLFQINYRWHKGFFKISRFSEFKTKMLDPTQNTRYAVKVLKNMSRFLACKGKNLPACFHAGPGWRKSTRKEKILLYKRRVHAFARKYRRKYSAWAGK